MNSYSKLLSVTELGGPIGCTSSLVGFLGTLLTLMGISSAAVPWFRLLASMWDTAHPAVLAMLALQNCRRHPACAKDMSVRASNATACTIKRHSTQRATHPYPSETGFCHITSWGAPVLSLFCRSAHANVAGGNAYNSCDLWASSNW